MNPPAVIRLDYGPVCVRCVPLTPAPTRREAELQAERRLLDGQLPCHTPEGVPFLPGSGLSLSITHSLTHAAVALSPAGPVGIDIETRRPQLRRVGHRVLSPSELEYYSAIPDGLLRAWTLKEALYKAALTPGVDFRRDICLPTAADPTTAYVHGRPYTILALRPLADGLMALVVKGEG